MKTPVELSRRRPVCAANAVCSTQQGLRYFRGAGGGGLRLPASASCLARCRLLPQLVQSERGGNSKSLLLSLYKPPALC
ncbi:hypothetical protein CGS50_006870 [Faecalibacterium prausnitzii]|uniref:Uncharacterized protein n=1 Tax=Faecalibacterium prausnitzii TaxID=853 RepID=A0A2J4JPA2_9FIRM|nr:hypothetical protein CGS50_006870 [Faecalibacterium prausnitzii]